MKDLAEINLESDSELEDSFYEKEKKRVQLELSDLRTNQNWSILE